MSDETTKHGQLPELSLSVVGEFFLRGRPAVVAAANPSLSEICIAAADHWKGAASIGNREALEDHLARFPNCAFSGLAKARLESLKVATAVQTPPLPPLPAPTPSGASRMTTQQAAKSCNSKSTDVDVQLNACTQIIESGKVNKKEISFAYNNRGAAFNQKREYDRAVSEYTRAIDLNPQYARAFVNRGNNFYAIGSIDSALADYSEAIKIDPKYADAYTGRGWVFYVKNDYERAFADYNIALKLDPNNIFAYNNRGLAFARSG